MFMLLLAVAGNETTRNATAHGMYALLTNPEQFELLKSDPEGRIDDAVEEILRWASPVLHFRRTATVDTEIRGRQIKAGDRVVIWHISANRDEEVCDDPFVFDITRNPNPHVAFGGGGSHFCLGANLARMELKLILTELVTRMPDMQLAGEPERLLSNFIGGIKHMPVKWTPGPRVLTDGLSSLQAGSCRARSTARPAPPRSTRTARRRPGSGCCTARPGSPARWSRSTATRSCCAATPGWRSATATCPARSRSTAPPTHLVPVREPSTDDGPTCASPTACAPRRGAARWSAPRPAWRGRAGSGSRACTTPSSSSGCGATTCASRASSSSASTAPTTWPTRSQAFGPDRDHRLGVLLDHLVAGQQGGAPGRRRCATRTCW